MTNADFVTHSLIKSFARCPRATMYKYVDCLEPRRANNRALKRGVWFHDLMDVFYTFGGFQGGFQEVMDEVKERHREHTLEFNKLMDEEKDMLGHLPQELWRLFIAYLWHYRKDSGWNIHESEIKLEGQLPNGIMIQGKVDLLAEDQYGFWMVDHKTHKMIPSLLQRMLDRQSIVYLWLASLNGYDPTGFIWNYIKTEAPPRIRFTKGSKNIEPRIVANQGATDYWTALKSIEKQYPEYLDRDDIKEFLKPLYAQRFDPDRGIQTSPFFIRERMEKDTGMVNRALAEVSRTAEEFMNYDFEDRDAVVRVNERSCDWCPFRNLCVTELIGGNADNVMRQEFRPAEPFGYYDRQGVMA